jgi:hypothetical protein
MIDSGASNSASGVIVWTWLDGLFRRFWSYIVSEIQNEKTASFRPSVLLGVGPRGPPEVDPAMGWLSSSSPSSLKPTWLDRTILPLYGRAVCSVLPCCIIARRCSYSTEDAAQGDGKYMIKNIT